MKVLGLGTAAIDVVLKCDKLPEKDGFSLIKNEKIIPGGSCANVLVTLSKLGIHTALINKLGDDFYSNTFMEDLKQNNICTKYMKIDKGGSILHTYITVGEKGEKCIFSNFGKSLLSLNCNEVDETMLDDVLVFYTDMFPGKPALKLAHLCKQRNIKVVFNLQCAPSFMNNCGVTNENLEEMISLSDIFLGCSEGLFELSNCNNHEEAAKFLYNKYSPKLGVISTCGSKGALWVDKDDNSFCTAFNIDSVDTTGAGDSFIGGLIYYYFIEKQSKLESLSFACACAAIKCTQTGGRIDTNLDKVLKFMKTNLK